MSEKNAKFRQQLQTLNLSEQAIETLGFFGIETYDTFEEMPSELLEKMSFIKRLCQQTRFLHFKKTPSTRIKTKAKPNLFFRVY